MRFCIDCQHERTETPATHTIPNPHGARTIALCEQHAAKARRFHRVTPIGEGA